MTDSILTVLENERINKNVFKMRLFGDVSANTLPGQFINIKLDGFFLRRPISVFDFDDETIQIVYKVVGDGTDYLSHKTVDSKLDCLVGLGNGFNTKKSGALPVVVGGGVGTPPMYNLAKKLVLEGKDVTAILGFNTTDEIILKDDFESLGVKTYVTTVDGSFGTKGFVTDKLNDFEYTYCYSCGPEPMLKAVYDCMNTDGEFSFEERMGCGFGACMGCTCKTKYGYKRICRDGPVLERGEIIW